MPDCLFDPTWDKFLGLCAASGTARLQASGRKYAEVISSVAYTWHRRCLKDGQELAVKEVDHDKVQAFLLVQTGGWQ